jgi:hypothetical protein
MRRRAPVVLAVVAVVCIVPTAVVNALLDYPDTIDLVANLGFTLLVLGAATTGAIVAARVPRNAVGWILLVLGTGMAFTLACGAYAEASATASAGPFPGDQWLAWLGNWLGIPVIFGATGFLLLLFPDGRPVSPRWRPVGWLLGAAVTLAALSSALTPGAIGEPGFANPVAPDGAAGELAVDFARVIDLLALPMLLLAAAALVVRFRRSRGVERLQLKWFTYAAAAAGVGLGLSSSAGGVAADAGFLVGLLALAALPVAAGVAVLRYRLYDIDLVIRRTLIYGALTATLGATYLALVVLIGLAVGESDLAIAASTLAVAALFRPARARIQAVVDRRFYRRRYDAARTLEAFGGRLRDELDLDALSGEVRGVVRETVQPAHVSLWLRGER